jgi:glycyl-tRNA synthetase beta subunit
MAAMVEMGENHMPFISNENLRISKQTVYYSSIDEMFLITEIERRNRKIQKELDQAIKDMFERYNDFNQSLIDESIKNECGLSYLLHKINN